MQEKKKKNNQNNEVVIDLKGMSKSFGNLTILNKIDLQLHKTNNIAILGRSGTGKSVLLKCIVGLIPPDEGKINLLGKDIDTLDEPELNQLRLRIGYLFQGGALYDSMTVRDNLSFPLKQNKIMIDENKIEDEVLDALSNVGLEDAINKMPSELSGGMKKRIGLARTLMLKPEIIFYDEPTTGLDPVTSSEISELMQRINKKFKTSSLIVTHDMKCAEQTADKIMILHDGKFIAGGQYKELENSEKKLVRSFFSYT
ncbi:MAG: ABC transporter ATP-binding protein [Bacteroidota bacterium]